MRGLLGINTGLILLLISGCTFVHKEYQIFSINSPDSSGSITIAFPIDNRPFSKRENYIYILEQKPAKNVLSEIPTNGTAALFYDKKMEYGMSICWETQPIQIIANYKYNNLDSTKINLKKAVSDLEVKKCAEYTFNEIVAENVSSW